MLTCTFENGSQTTCLRHATVTVLLVRQDEIILVKRSPDLINGGKYALPGGYVESNERLIEAATRELYEETGYKVASIDLFLMNDHPQRLNEDRQNIDFAYIAQPGLLTGEPDQESTEVKWFSIHQLPSETSIGFDHYQLIKKFIEYQKNPFPLPILHFEY